MTGSTTVTPTFLTKASKRGGNFAPRMRTAPPPWTKASRTSDSSFLRSRRGPKNQMEVMPLRVSAVMSPLKVRTSETGASRDSIL